MSQIGGKVGTCNFPDMNVLNPWVSARLHNIQYNAISQELCRLAE